MDCILPGSSIHGIFQARVLEWGAIAFCFINYAKAFDCVGHSKLWKILQEMGYQTTWPASWEICIQVKKQQLELDMEQQTGSKLEKEYVKGVFRCVEDGLNFGSKVYFYPVVLG